jgi:hypothetical protein
MTQTAVASRIGTCTLTGKIVTLNVTEGYRSMSLKLISGTVTYMGSESINADDGTAIASSAETLDANGFELVCENSIDGFVIDATLGSVILAFIK